MDERDIYIYRNGEIHCIISTAKAQELLNLLREAYPHDIWEKEKREG